MCFAPLSQPFCVVEISYPSKIIYYTLQYSTPGPLRAVEDVSPGIRAPPLPLKSPYNRSSRRANVEYRSPPFVRFIHIGVLSRTRTLYGDEIYSEERGSVYQLNGSEIILVPSFPPLIISDMGSLASILWGDPSFQTSCSLGLTAKPIMLESRGQPTIILHP